MTPKSSMVENEVNKLRARRLGLSTLLRDGANIAVLLGIIFAVAQLTTTAKIERVRLAIEAASATQTKDFLDSYSKLLEGHRADPSMVGSDSLRDDLLYVMNVYDSVAVLYLNGLLDNAIVEKRLCDGMGALAPILDAMKWPIANRYHFDTALEQMRRRSQSLAKQ